MFRLEARRNPLEMLVTETGKQFVESRVKRNRDEKRTKATEGILSQLDEDSSPLAWAKAINKYSKELEPEDVEQLYKLPEIMQRSRAPEAKRALKERDDAEKQEKASQNLWNLAVNMGVDPSLIPENTPYAQGVQIIKDFREQAQAEEINGALREATGDPLIDKKTPIEIYNENVEKFGHAKAKDIADLARQSRPKLNDPAEKRRQRDSLKTGYKSLENYLKDEIKNAVRTSDSGALRQRLKEVQIAQAKDNQLIEKGELAKHYYDVYEKVLGQKLVEREDEEAPEAPMPVQNKPAVKKGVEAKEAKQDLDTILFG